MRVPEKRWQNFRNPHEKGQMDDPSDARGDDREHHISPTHQTKPDPNENPRSIHLISCYPSIPMTVVLVARRRDRDSESPRGGKTRQIHQLKRAKTKKVFADSSGRFCGFGGVEACHTDDDSWNAGDEKDQMDDPLSGGTRRCRGRD